jgi:hypothetical protein
MEKLSGTPEQLLARRKWIDALRSGEYTQGKSALNKNGNFCCLGVACDVSELGKWRELYSGKRFYHTKGEYEPAGYMLAEPVMEWLGLPNTECSLGDYAAWQLNDSLNKSFDEIADWLEKKLEVAP